MVATFVDDYSERIKIDIGQEAIEIAEGVSDGDIVLQFYVSDGTSVFPDISWNEMGYLVLAIWAQTIWDNRFRYRASYILNFIEGPFALVVKQLYDCAYIYAIETRKHQRIWFRVKCKMIDVLTELYKAFSALKMLADGIDHNNIPNIEGGINHYMSKLSTLISRNDKADSSRIGINTMTTSVITTEGRYRRGRSIIKARKQT